MGIWASARMAEIAGAGNFRAKLGLGEAEEGISLLSEARCRTRFLCV